MTALKRTVRTRRGVEPTGRPARREVELGKRQTSSSRTFAQSGRAAWLASAGFAISSNRSSVPTRTSGADGALRFCPV